MQKRNIDILLNFCGLSGYEYLELDETKITRNNTLLELYFSIIGEGFNVKEVCRLADAVLNLRINVQNLNFIFLNLDKLADVERFSVANYLYKINSDTNTIIDFKNGIISLEFSNLTEKENFKKNEKRKLDYYFSKYNFDPQSIVYYTKDNKYVKEDTNANSSLESDDLNIYENNKNEASSKSITVKSSTTYDGEKLISELPKTKDDLDDTITQLVEIKGEIFSIESKEMKSKTLYSIYITDYEDSILVKVFKDKSWTFDFVSLKVGDAIKVKGEVKYDSFIDDVILMASKNTISKIENNFKEDFSFENAVATRAELHAHSTFTTQDGLTTVEDYFKNASKFGLNAIAITDLENVQAYPEIVAMSKKYGIRPIYGVELNVVDEDKFKIVYERGEHDNSFVGLDIETTGFSANYDDIIEISAYKIENGIPKEYSVFVKLDQAKLTNKITELTSITQEMLNNEGIDVKEALKGFIDFVGNSYIVAHNAKFDIPFIEEKIRKYLGIEKKYSYIDTLNFAKVMLKDELKRFSLDVVSKKLGVNLEQHHRAIYDTMACYNIFVELVKRLVYSYKEEFSIEEYPINAKMPYNNRKTEILILDAIKKCNNIDYVQNCVEKYQEEQGYAIVVGNEEFIKNHASEFELTYSQKEENTFIVYYKSDEQKKLVKKLNTKVGHKKNIISFELVIEKEKQSKSSGEFVITVDTKEHFDIFKGLDNNKIQFYKVSNEFDNGFESLNDLIDQNERWRGLFPYHITILVKTQNGLKNLFKMISEAHTKYVAREVIVPKRILENYREGLLIGTSCYNGLFRTVYEKGFNQVKEEIDFYDYIELQPIECYYSYKREEDDKIDEYIIDSMKKLYEYATSRNKIVIASSDSHYLRRNQQKYREIYINTLMVGGKMHNLYNKIPSINELKTSNEMITEFERIFDSDVARKIVFDGPNEIVSMIDDDIRIIHDHLCVPTDDFLKNKVLPVVGHTVPSIIEEFKSIVKEAMQKYYFNGKLPPLIFNRIKKEMNSILTNGFTVNYYIAYLLVKQSNKDGYVVGSRGSVGSSFVAYLMGITEVNALAPHYYCPYCHYTQFKVNVDERNALKLEQKQEELQKNLDNVGSGFDLPDAVCPICGKPLKKDGHDIPFETFLGFNGDKVPDIDLNFSGDYQWKAHNFCKEVFGEDHAFRAGTIATVAEKTACGYVRKFAESKGIKMRGAEVIRTAKILEGTKRTTGQHPGGIIVIPANYDVYDFTPVQFPANDTSSSWMTTHFDYHGVLDETLLKLDILGHDDPTILKKLMDYVHDHQEEFPFSSIKDIPLDDPEVYKMLYPDENENVKSLAIPEFGTKFVTEMLKDTKPTNFAQLVKISGLSHGTDVWLNNAKDLISGDTEYGNIEFKDIIGCRDDIMVQLMYFGCESSKAFEIMEFVRKGKPSKDPDKWNEHKQYLKEHKVPDWYIWSCERIKYMFPKAHATAYVLSAMRIAWFKVHKPILFYSTYFSVRAIGKIDLETIVSDRTTIARRISEISSKGFSATALELDQKDILEVALECVESGIDIIVPNLNKSLVNDFIPLTNQNCLLASLTSIGGLGEDVAIRLVEDRKDNPISNIEDLKSRKILNKTVIQTIENLDCEF